MKSKDIPLSLRLALQTTAMVTNFHLIVSFSDSGLGQLLTSCNVEGFTSVVFDVEDQAPENDLSKSVENLVGYVQNVVKI